MFPGNQTPSLEPRIPRPLRRLLFGGLLLGGLLAALFAWPLIGDQLLPHGAGLAAEIAFTATPTAFQNSFSPTPQPSESPTLTPTFAAPIESNGSLGGLIVVSFAEQGYAHLFAYQVAGEPFTRLTSGTWDDINPALSPDGSKLAFASNRAGHWDLYLLDLASGETIQLSNDPAYDGHPSWSRDGAWLAYEHYEKNNLEIMMRPIDGSQDAVNLSASGTLDYAPSWRPHTDEVAFVSDRSGQPAIWIVNLEDSGSSRFNQLLTFTSGIQKSPVWSPDGASIAWAEQDADGIWRIYAINLNDPLEIKLIGIGEDPQWAPNSEIILAALRGAETTYLTAYTLDGGLALAPELLPGHFEGAAWAAAALPNPLPASLADAAADAPSADWEAMFNRDSQQTKNIDTVSIDVQAPYAQLNELAAAPFAALRDRAAQLLGWDPLSNLEYAYVPLTAALPPDRQQDWLYTGRAFSLQSGLLNAGWMAAVREDINGETYWHIYLRAAQDNGGQGRPLTSLPWDFSARYTGSEASYQNGGKLAAKIPAGYWIDFTALAADYGFQRLPALPNWRSYFQGALFNEFALRAGLSWHDAMLQLYSANAVATAEAAGN